MRFTDDDVADAHGRRSSLDSGNNIAFHRRENPGPGTVRPVRAGADLCPGGEQSRAIQFLANPDPPGLFSGGVIAFLVAWALAELLSTLALWLAAAHELARRDLDRRPRGGWLKTVVRENPGIWRFAWFANAAATLALAWRQVGTLAVGIAASPAAGGYRSLSPARQRIKHLLLELIPVALAGIPPRWTSPRYQPTSGCTTSFPRSPWLSGQGLPGENWWIPVAGENAAGGSRSGGPSPADRRQSAHEAAGGRRLQLEPDRSAGAPGADSNRCRLQAASDRRLPVTK